MPVRIIQGPLDEEPGGPGARRLARGEFLGHRGELASYALAWTSDADTRAGRITVGIGRGNPGGGTFHAAAFVHDGRIAYALVDEPLTEVPQGGPHLTAAQARAHEDLPYVWHVIDSVMARDHRALWMYHWALGTSAIITGEVAEDTEPVLLLCNDENEEPPLWQAIGSSDADPATGRISHLHHLVDADPTLAEVLDLLPGERARRSGVGQPWTRSGHRTPDRPSGLRRILGRQR